MLLVLSACRTEEDPRLAIEANRELDRRRAAAWEALDVDALMRCWWNDDSAAFFPADDPDGRMGFKRIRASYAQQMTSLQRIEEFETSLPQYRVLGDAVVSSGRIRMVVVPKGARQAVELDMHYTDIRKRVDGAWVYVYAHESMSPLSAGMGIP